MSKVYLGVGHGGSDPGAVKYVVEKDVNLKMALACRDYLEANGVEVKISRTTDIDKDLNARINECNKYNPNLAVDIHNNAGGGDGFEVYHTIYGGTGKTLAKNIEDEVKKIGQNSRGLKTRKRSDGTDYFGFIKFIASPCSLTIFLSQIYKPLWNFIPCISSFRLFINSNGNKLAPVVINAS